MEISQESRGKSQESGAMSDEAGDANLGKYGMNGTRV